MYKQYEEHLSRKLMSTFVKILWKLFLTILILIWLINLQIGLMWRQTGPIIISMSYMISDVMIFLFIFGIVYISFTLVTVYVYDSYSHERVSKIK